MRRNLAAEGDIPFDLFVDIPNVFRDFDADENDPKNYDFVGAAAKLLRGLDV